jgi:hypothetical protein
VVSLCEFNFKIIDLILVGGPGWYAVVGDSSARRSRQGRQRYETLGRAFILVLEDFRG